jgi:integrase
LHDLRHTFATLALQERIAVKMVSEILGHVRVGVNSLYLVNGLV